MREKCECVKRALMWALALKRMRAKMVLKGYKEKYKKKGAWGRKKAGARQTDQTRAGSSLSLSGDSRWVTPQNWMPPNSSVALLINRWLLLMGCTQPENPAPSLPMHWDSHQVFVLVDVSGYMGNWTKPKTEMVWFRSCESQKTGWRYLIFV